MSELVTILHKVCGQPAFLYSHNPKGGEVIKRVESFHLDGSPFTHFENANYCESCGIRITSAHSLAPAPPEVRSYDMTNSADMRKLYKGVENKENLP